MNKCDEVFALMEALTMEALRGGPLCFSPSVDGEQLSLGLPQEPGAQRQDLMLLREHLFPIEPLLGWALSSTCSRASGLFFWAAVSRSPLLSALSFVLSPLSLATGHGLGPGWLCQLG